MRSGPRRLLMQDPHRRGREIVELPGARRPGVGPDEERDQQERERDQHEEHAHPTLVVKVRLRQAPTIAVTELTGIRIAATNGSSRPVNASTTATAL